MTEHTTYPTFDPSRPANDPITSCCGRDAADCDCEDPRLRAPEVIPPSSHYGCGNDDCVACYGNHAWRLGNLTPAQREAAEALLGEYDFEVAVDMAIEQEPDPNDRED